MKKETSHFELIEEDIEISFRENFEINFLVDNAKCRLTNSFKKHIIEPLGKKPILNFCVVVLTFNKYRIKSFATPKIYKKELLGFDGRKLMTEEQVLYATASIALEFDRNQKFLPRLGVNTVIGFFVDRNNKVRTVRVRRGFFNFNKLIFSCSQWEICFVDAVFIPKIRLCF
jgi:hypothetical protein